MSLISLLSVESGWEIIAMVSKDLGRQSLFIPVRSFHTIVFSYKILKENQTTSSSVLCLLFMKHSLLFLFLLSPGLPTCLHPCPLSRGSSASTCCVTSPAEHRSCMSDKKALCQMFIPPAPRGEVIHISCSLVILSAGLNDC